MKEITTQKLAYKRYIDMDQTIEVDVHEIVLRDTTTGELRYNKMNVVNKTPDQLWDISEPCDYVKAREVDYPSLQEQQDMQFWDLVNGTTTFKDAIQQVKNRYPKP